MTSRVWSLESYGASALRVLGCGLLGVVLGAVLGSWIGGLLGDPEGEGFLGFLLGLRLGGLAGMLVGLGSDLRSSAWEASASRPQDAQAKRVEPR